jgi:hypothetical protein
MPRRRTTADWQQLIAEFEASDQTIQSFCNDRGLSAGYFGKRRALLRKRGSAFSVGRVSAPSIGAVSIQMGELAIRCDSSVPASWLAELVTTLRS